MVLISKSLAVKIVTVAIVLLQSQFLYMSMLLMLSSTKNMLAFYQERKLFSDLWPVLLRAFYYPSWLCVKAVLN